MSSPPHDPALVEALARVICETMHPTKDADDLVPLPRGLHGAVPRWEAHYAVQARAALTALCAARPDVAALLAGEAVAVPREATDAMLGAMQDMYLPFGEMLAAWDGAIAASPYAKGGGA